MSVRPEEISQEPEPHRMSTAAKVAIILVLAVLAGSFVVLSRISTEGQGGLLTLTLVNINLILVVALVLLLSRNIVKWFFEGYRLRSLRTRLAVAFMGFALIPTVLLFVVASELLTNSVDSWFSPQVEGAMEGAVKVARDRYRETHLQVEADLQRLSEILPRLAPPVGSKSLPLWLEGKRKSWGLSGLALRYGEKPDQVATAGGMVAAASAFAEDEGIHTVTVADGEMVRAHVVVDGWGDLIAERLVPTTEIIRLRRITNDYENFAQLAAFKEPIQEGYRLSFLVISLVILFSASWFGFYIARSVTNPMQRLVEGTRQVAAGNLDIRLKRRNKDEVGELVTAFNAMTEELSRNKDDLTLTNDSLTATNQELDARGAYMEAILENAATGVIALDTDGRVSLFNRAAAEILQLDPDAVTGRPYREAFRDVSLQVVSQLVDLLRKGGETGERELTLKRTSGTLTLRVHARRVVRPDGASLGVMLVFDDLSELIRVQKAAAWQEVAQRLAHEIKNPLTPIQLSVQRLQKRYGKEGKKMPKLVEETTDTILEEVSGLKRLVDEFSEFARMPEPMLERQSIWDLIGEVAALYRQAYPDVTVTVEEAELGELDLDRKQMRRVFTNLFENAVEAMEGTGGIHLSGRVEGAEWAEIRFTDTGPGIDPEQQENVFLPYFSRREGGSGLGLAIVARILEEHGGRVRLEAGESGGAAFVLSLPIFTDKAV